MESRQKLPRKARDGATSKSTRSESADSETRSKPDDEAATKETGAIRKNTRTLRKALSEDPAPVSSAKGSSKKKMASGKGAKKPIASKTDDDIPQTAAPTKPRATKRRSRSVEPVGSVASTSKGAKADAAKFPDDLQIPPSKGRNKRKVTPIPEDEEEVEAKKPRGRGRAMTSARAPAKSSAKAPAAAKESSPEPEEEAKKVKGRRGKRAAATSKVPVPAKASSGESEEDVKENVKSNGQALKNVKPQSANRRVNVAALPLMLSEESEPEAALDTLKKTKATPQPKKDRAAASKSESEDKVAEEAADGDDEPSPPKKSRGAAKPVSKEEEESQEDEEEGEPKAGKSGKKLMNKTDTDYKKINFGIKEKFNLKIATWNVSGLRALASKNPDYFTKENADIICLNEVKIGNEDEIPKEFVMKGYHTYWNIGKGDNGVSIYSKEKPVKVTNDLPDTDFADAKRLITAEYEKFFLTATYVVNAGQGLKTLDKRLQWNDAFDAHVAELNKKKPVIICGDLNVSHQEIDLANPKANKRNAGFTQEERDGFSKLLSAGFIDTYRALHPETTGAYTFWSYRGNARSKNVGWRLDYFVVSKSLMKNVKESAIRSEVLGSDHCPIVLFLNL